MTKHLKNVFEGGELSEDSVCAKFAQTADDGKTCQYKFYSLSAIIAVGYRITPRERRNSASGRPRYLTHLPSRDMFWIRIGWSTVRFSMKIIFATWFLKSRRFGQANAASIRKSQTSMRPPWTILLTVKPQKISSPLSKIKCTTLSMAARRQRSLWSGQTTPKNIWA